MKIALINASPKEKNSASEAFLRLLNTLLPVGYEIVKYHFRAPKVSNQALEQISESDVLVFAMPLYFDGIPSNLIPCLYQMETFLKTRPSKNIMVYTLVNCGFYEGHQCAIALDIMKNWCAKAELTWGQGIGLGGGGMMQSLANVPNGRGPKKNFMEALKSIAGSISSGTTADHLFISPNFPQFAYKLGAEMGWRQQIKANGLKRKDLFRKR